MAVVISHTPVRKTENSFQPSSPPLELVWERKTIRRQRRNVLEGTRAPASQSRVEEKSCGAETLVEDRCTRIEDGLSPSHPLEGIFCFPDWSMTDNNRHQLGKGKLMVAARCYVSPVRLAKSKKDDKILFWSM